MKTEKFSEIHKKRGKKKKKRDTPTLFLRMISEALRRDWMQADKASWDKPWKTALWKKTKSQWETHE